MTKLFSKKFRGLMAAATMAGLLSLGGAGVAKSVDLTADQSARVKEVASYIQGFKTLQGEFTQVSSKGNVSKGVFILSKPGKMRFEYASPNPFIIVSDGTWVTIKNRAKDKAEEYPLSQTPLRLVLDDDIDLLEEANILDVDIKDGLTTITLQDRKKTVPGHLIITYDEAKKALQQWVVVDGQGRRTTVSLENIVAGGKPDPKLFKVEVRRLKDKKR
ncbi:LolA family protein [Taklimakanibacter deserti]|uniref:LolA family protein n=1 Tax=Taklimakanibacter deserti TaxID=2267839 RepID=UPI000E645DC2